MIYFFGCAKIRDGQGVGHYLYTRGLRLAHQDTTPWGPHPDGTLCPHLGERCTEHQCQCGQPERIAVIHHKDGWTALSFWDRTGDSRGNSNSNFLVEGIYDFAQMVALATEHFPEIAKRVRLETIKENTQVAA